ncbi:phosphonate C-P lyase system protein PhnL [Sporolactobacillus terrae]|uniref:ABC transporter n=1 Tax=Sporolactobacillus terrae TaxID=269673 RepID=A0A410D5F0_9BACL|nr:phosphonate C-P lyase system protein PhnL [Sporolactobacillus terrae]QAA21319.1 phosphonate C-P lyase system protein PhnL [Sporolactobacillus terrae]QAA24291.1 phosphonate C-P lyase system protein PhnL [Sporolactobacillus terrae]UAK16095.1 phosphonate C-P lyase system protein PhnL [Sporolactobacillus terrae]BBN97534.1 ABC transporter [Sporolactobacillus terrae]
MEELLHVDHLEKTFTIHQFNDKKITGCRNIHFSVNQGEFLGITGQSGSGKSTIIKCIYRTYLPSNGHIHYASDRYGRIDLAEASERTMLRLRKEEIGYVSQFLSIMPRMTALEFVMESLLEMGEGEAAARMRAKAMLTHFNLREVLWDTYPKTFSGGEKLRLNLARAMVRQTKLLLLDEPTASLDQASKASVKERIQELKQRGTTMIGIFHDLDFMESVVDRTFRLQNGLLKEAAQ